MTVAALKLKATSKFNKNLAALILQHGTFEHKDPDKNYLLALADALAKAVTCDLPLPGTDGSAPTLVSSTASVFSKVALSPPPGTSRGLLIALLNRWATCIDVDTVRDWGDIGAKDRSLSPTSAAAILPEDDYPQADTQTHKNNNS